MEVAQLIAHAEGEIVLGVERAEPVVFSARPVHWRWKQSRVRRQFSAARLSLEELRLDCVKLGAQKLLRRHRRILSRRRAIDARPRPEAVDLALDCLCRAP